MISRGSWASLGFLGLPWSFWGSPWALPWPSLGSAWALPGPSPLKRPCYANKHPINHIRGRYVNP
eukprot:2475624-Karenia_brevis.AAC.2